MEGVVVVIMISMRRPSPGLQAPIGSRPTHHRKVTSTTDLPGELET